MKCLNVGLRFAAMGLLGAQVFAADADTPQEKATVSRPVTFSFDTIDVTNSAERAKNLQLRAVSNLAPRVFYYDQQGKALSIAASGWENGPGVELEAVDDAIRSQLGLPEGQGLVVTAVAPEGPAARVGLVRSDVLLTIDDKPLGKPGDLTAHLKAVGEKQVAVRLLRNGKPISLSAKPVYRVYLGAVTQEPDQYYIGVVSDSVDDTLRSQLNLAADAGLVARSVEPESPAAKAGVKPFDILLKIENHDLKNRDSLVEQIQGSEGKPLHLHILRAGKPQVVEVTPVLRPKHARETLSFHANPVYSYRVVRPVTETERTTTGRVITTTPTLPAVSSAKQLEDVLKELQSLHRAVEKLQKELEEKKKSEQNEK